MLITGSADVQGDRIEVLTQGWGEEKERWNIEHKVFWGDPEKLQVWRELDEFLKKTYRVGVSNLKIAAFTVDSGFKPDSVYKFTKKRQSRKVFSTKGSSGYYDPICSKPRTIGRHRATLYMVGSDTAKDSIILSSLKIKKPGPGCIHFPLSCDEDFFAQLTAEKRSRERGKFVWKPIRERNEILDLHVGNMAAYDILNPNINMIKIKRKKKRQEKVDEPDTESLDAEFNSNDSERVKKPRNKVTRIRRRKNWVTDF